MINKKNKKKIIILFHYRKYKSFMNSIYMRLMGHLQYYCSYEIYDLLENEKVLLIFHITCEKLFHEI